MALLEVKDLEVTISAEGRVAKAPNGVSFALEAGEVLGIVGESGSGKSMTALAIARLLPLSCRVSRGSVRFDGTDLLSLPAEAMRRMRGAEIAMIFQDPLSSLNPVLTIGEQISEPLEIHEGIHGRSSRHRVLDLLGKVEIPEPALRINQFPHELSGGMRQRVMIAIAIACRPRLLIADEPTTALDVTVQAKILRLLRRLQQEYRMATIFISHDLGIIAQFADRVAVMYAGRLVEHGSVEAVLQEPRHPYTQALLRSIPTLDRGDKLSVIPGNVPSLSDLPAGCPFHPRCNYGEASCATMPEHFISQFSATHSAACIRYSGYQHDG